MKCTLDKHVGSIKLLNHHFVYKTKLIKITDKKNTQPSLSNY